jgi:hypothetical protein
VTPSRGRPPRRDAPAQADDRPELQQPAPPRPGHDARPRRTIARMHAAPNRSIAVLVSILAVGCGDPAIECGEGTLVVDGEDELCVFDAAPDHACPEGLPYQLYIQSGFPGWTEICTSRAPAADGTLELSASVCAAAGGRGGCVAATAMDGGLCCPYTGSCSSGGHGGWAPRTESCPRPWAFDGAFSPQTDAWGCSYLDARGFCPGGQACCIE